MDRYIGLDFETYGAVDLPRHGLERYMADSTFKVLLAATSEKTADGLHRNRVFDFVRSHKWAREKLLGAIEDKIIVAHNAGFERRALKELGIDLPADRFIDSAVVSRAAGASGRLEAAAPQLLGIDKVEAGKNLMKLFSIVSPERREQGNLLFDPQVVEDNPTEWNEYKHYCQMDANLSLRIWLEWGKELEHITAVEPRYQAVTMEMNQTGWYVDVPKVQEMLRRYEENKEAELESFRVAHDATQLNLNSLKQMKEWCSVRGVKATSFDEKHVEKLLARVEARIAKGIDSPEKISNDRPGI